MEIEWMYGLIGGLMIGFAAAIYLLMNGRIMGASGIAGSLVDGTAGSERMERAAFLVGLVGAPALAGLFMKIPATNTTSNALLLVVAGLMVGLGTRLGSGCTSGHGVCGMSRFSVRSITATCIYIGGGVLVIVAARGIGVL